MASCDHAWGPWNSWTQTCNQSRSRVCNKCGDFDYDYQTVHQWGTSEENPRKITCQRCGQSR